SRILAHLCAPVCVVLTGLSAYLSQAKNNSIAMTRMFLLKRGLFLIFLELIVINFAWTGQFPPDVIYLQVIWAIGLSMVVLAGLIGFSQQWLWVISLSIIFGHNLLDQVSFEHLPIVQNIWFILHERGWIELGEHIRFRTSYPLLPWIGVITLGYCIGHTIFNSTYDVAKRNQILLGFGLASISLFIVLRMINLYGDQAWSVMPTSTETVMSFLNLTKYPPSLLFILWNVGLGLILLVLLQKVESKPWIKPLIVFGSVPMFFYIVHLYVLKALYLIAVALFGTTHGEYFGVDHVSTLWLISIILTVALYPLMLKFSAFKHKNKHIRILKYL
ncbi:MAG: heparan-alpha-glucosaminide N-acetyltransferase domain-containing protein, partial [Acinetobacter sp.]